MMAWCRVACVVMVDDEGPKSREMEMVMAIPTSSAVTSRGWEVVGIAVHVPSGLELSVTWSREEGRIRPTLAHCFGSEH